MILIVLCPTHQLILPIHGWYIISDSCVPVYGWMLYATSESSTHSPSRPVICEGERLFMNLDYIWIYLYPLLFSHYRDRTLGHMSGDTSITLLINILTTCFYDYISTIICNYIVWIQFGTISTILFTVLYVGPFIPYIFSPLLWQAHTFCTNRWIHRHHRPPTPFRRTITILELSDDVIWIFSCTQAFCNNTHVQYLLHFFTHDIFV